MFCLLNFPTVSYAQDTGTMDVTLGWDASTSKDVIGYKAYYSKEPGGQYTDNIDAGNVLEYEIKGLIKGTTYYFAVTAYDAENRESNFSNQISTDGEISFPPAAPDNLKFLKVKYKKPDGTVVVITVPIP